MSEIKDLLSRSGHCQQFYQQFMCRTEHAPRHDLERGCNENAHSQNTQQYQALGCAAWALLTILSTENVKKRTDERPRFCCSNLRHQNKFEYNQRLTTIS
ncbi:hypothetical protein E7V67_006665 [[Empedobacter] haloabium]|uniref:Uncharacterized protein n=1 Tax=[Empedobacter] haloabium TaxID=592317 RepID=A0ABZ1US39_9BURK